MIDIKLLQKDFDSVAHKLAKKGVDSQTLELLKEFAQSTKIKRISLEELQAEQNSLSSQFGVYKQQNLDIKELKEKIDKIKSLRQELENEVRVLEEELETKLYDIPNLPLDEVPEGKDENDNIVLEKILSPKEFSFTPKEHFELGELNNWLDFERGVKLAKSRFTALSGVAAKLERALINYMLDFNSARGFVEWNLPVLANSASLLGTGQLPKFADDLFKIEDEDLYLIPTSEVSLTNLYRDEILKADELPLKLTAYTPCFRKEAGSAGRDTRGMIRQHQFDKIELVAITKPQESEDIFNQMVTCASDLLTSLGLAHQKVMLCGGDLGFGAAKTIDLEVWLPGQNRYREISSISNTMDFQARRSKIRYKNGKKNDLVHTLNGSSLAVGRTLIAIMENYQNEDGTIDIPEVLKPYLK
ncbi:MAG: serine--tRNA ligase [Arcobacter butzleri]|jgi:seryl-tRNA synthetase|nr:serine--tRNA ligase [Arcobacteraceae bacterium]MDY0365158.1 serine--tRNA ligase [Arcobacteraceae bacterium]NLO16591.1 serine--tRNA ligase [Aliarcobacter butzleri]